MKFLVITRSKHLVPPNVSAGMIDAMGPWRSKYAANLEQIWSFAGIQGGGGIVNVGSLEELDALLAEFPMQAVSDIETIPLVELDSALRRAKQVAEAVAVGVG